MPALTKRSGSFVALRAHDRKSKQKCLELLKEVMHPTPLRTLIKQINDQRKLAKKRNAKKQTKTPKIKKTISKKSKMPKIKKTSKKVRSPAKRATFTSSVSVPKVADTVSSNVLLPGATRDHIWQFKENDGSWQPYRANASDVVEATYQSYLSNRGTTDVRSIKSGDWSYQVDFLAFKQTNIDHSNHTIRDIRRVPNENSKKK